MVNIFRYFNGCLSNIPTARLLNLKSLLKLEKFGGATTSIPYFDPVSEKNGLNKKNLLAVKAVPQYHDLNIVALNLICL